MTQHVLAAKDLTEGDRILLKDLRILTVEGTPKHDHSDTLIRYYELAAKEYGELLLASNKRVTVLCKKEGWCPIDQELASLI